MTTILLLSRAVQFPVMYETFLRQWIEMFHI